MTAPDPTPEDSRALATLVAGAMADAWDDGTEYATLPDIAPRWILTSDWLTQRDARIRAEALTSASQAIERWEARESVDVLTRGAWSDGVRYGVEVARHIVAEGGQP